MELYVEGQARLLTTGSHSMMTFTPLKGMSEVVKRFFEDSSPNRIHLGMSFDDCGHITPEIEANILSIYPEHEWAARRDGDPYFSEGAVFSTPLKMLLEEPWALGLGHPGLQIPAHWPLLWGIDFGIAHWFGAVLLAWDRDLDTGHILAAIKMHGLPLEHADAMKRIAANVPVAWPHDGTQRDKGSGEQLAKIYSRHGLNMLATHATHPTGGYSTEAGIMDLETHMRSSRFKVASILGEWHQEYRLYHRDKEGKILKVDDDLMSATRIAWMQRRSAKCVPLGSKTVKRRRTEGKIINPWTGQAA